MLHIHLVRILLCLGLVSGEANAMFTRIPLVLRGTTRQAQQMRHFSTPNIPGINTTSATDVISSPTNFLITNPMSPLSLNPVLTKNNFPPTAMVLERSEPLSGMSYLKKLQHDPWPFLSLVVERDRYLFTNDGFIAGFTYGDDFALTKLWEYPFNASKINYESGYLLLSNKHNNHIILDARTGQLISNFTHDEKDFYSIKLALINSQVVIKLDDLTSLNFSIKYLDIKTQAEIKRISFSPDQKNNPILHDTDAVYMSFRNGTINAIDSQDRTLWTTNLQINPQYTYIIQLRRIGEDKPLIATRGLDRFIYIFNKKSGAILKRIGLKSNGGSYDPVEVAEDDQNIYICTDTIAVYSKIDLKQIDSLPERGTKLVVDDQCLYVVYSKGYINVYNKFTLDLLDSYEFSSGPAGVKQFFVGPNHSLALYFTTYTHTSEFEGYGYEYVDTFKFTH